MSISQVLEVALGLALVYYLMGLLVSWMSKFVMDVFETRGRTLEGYLKRIVGGKSVRQLVSMPQIRSLAPVRYQDWRDFFSRSFKLVEKRVEKIPVENLIDAFFDLTQIDIAASGDELLAIIEKLPPSEGKTEMLRLINSGVSQAVDLRIKMGLWFDGLMAQSSAMFTALARRYVIFFALCVTLVFGVDSIDLFHQLWSSPDLRAIAAVKAQAYIDQNGYAADTEPLLTDLEDLTIRIGWSSILKNAPPRDSVWDFGKFWLLKITGLLLTTIAVSQGSSFWYDILRKVTQAKSPGSSASRPSEESTASPSAPTAPGPDPITGAYG